MSKRFVSIWFPYLLTDWLSNRKPELRSVPFVCCTSSQGRMIITAANTLAENQGVYKGMVLADARVSVPGILHFEEKPGLAAKLIHRFAEFCIRYSPCSAVDGIDGVLLDASGCSHLWGGDENYLTEIIKRLKKLGYTSRAAITDTIGASWALARYSKKVFVVPPGKQAEALLELPVESLRIEPATVERLNKLGLLHVKKVIGIPGPSLRRRFGPLLMQRINQAAGFEQEFLQPVQPVEPYQERLPSLEPIVTLTGIEIALKQLLETLCKRLRAEGKGLRMANLNCYRIDGNIQSVSMGTIRPSTNEKHLFKLFEEKLGSIAPDLGIELFVLQAPKVEDYTPQQEALWETAVGLENTKLGELLDRVADKISPGAIHRYLPAEHYWPERAVQTAATLTQQPASSWKIDRPRPIQLLATPERIDVTAPIPDYPPMNFLYRNNLHKVMKADGPERIEQEWWLQEGEHRDYYTLEDEDGNRYWVFRSGHYTGDKTHQWFLHGIFP